MMMKRSFIKRPAMYYNTTLAVLITAIILSIAIGVSALIHLYLNSPNKPLADTEVQLYVTAVRKLVQDEEEFTVDSINQYLDKSLRISGGKSKGIGANGKPYYMRVNNPNEVEIISKHGLSTRKIKITRDGMNATIERRNILMWDWEQ